MKERDTPTANRILFSVLLGLCVFWPFLFGIPVLTAVGDAADANFALGLISGYAAALHAGDLLPRWVQQGNMGFGSPVFYFYGRLPFLFPAALTAVFHLGAAAALAITLALFRLLAFVTCRAWLRRSWSPRAAGWSALAFVAFPFAMLYNPLDRVGFSEVAATSLIPLCFLALDLAVEADGRRQLRSVGILGLVYAVLAALHLPQTLLAILAVTGYALLRAGVRGALLNVAGAACGLLLSASSILPALLLQPAITPDAWRADPLVAMANSFLFSSERYRQHSTLSSECYLYSTWALCMLAAAALAWALARRAVPPSRRMAALLIAQLVCLLSMTKLGWLFWMYVPGMQTLQFTWRIFPATLVLTAAVLASLFEKPRGGAALRVVVSLLIVGEAAVPLVGYLGSAGAWGPAAHLPKQILLRIPAYVPWSQRDLPSATSARAMAPEYVPSAATAVGWKIEDEHQLEQSGSVLSAPVLPAGIIEQQQPSGSIILRGNLAQPTPILLHCFWFPDEEVTGGGRAQVQLDPSTALARVALPPGPVQVRFSHGRTLLPVKLADAADLLGALLLLGCFAASRTRQQLPRGGGERDPLLQARPPRHGLTRDILSRMS